jgi:hypothetical protein
MPFQMPGRQNCSKHDNPNDSRFTPAAPDHGLPTATGCVQCTHTSEWAAGGLLSCQTMRLSACAVVTTVQSVKTTHFASQALVTLVLDLP